MLERFSGMTQPAWHIAAHGSMSSEASVNQYHFRYCIIEIQHFGQGSSTFHRQSANLWLVTSVSWKRFSAKRTSIISIIFVIDSNSSLCYCTMTILLRWTTIISTEFYSGSGKQIHEQRETKNSPVVDGLWVYHYDQKYIDFKSSFFLQKCMLDSYILGWFLQPLCNSI